jgi:O-antigen/teichoic acid export membrane protein
MIAVNAALALVLVPILGITGAAMAYSLSFVAYAVCFHAASARLVKSRV